MFYTRNLLLRGIKNRPVYENLQKSISTHQKSNDDCFSLAYTNFFVSLLDGIDDEEYMFYTVLLSSANNAYVDYMGTIWGGE